MNIKHCGFTILEMIIAMAILSVILVFTGMFMENMSENVALQQNVGTLELEANSAMDAMVESLRAAWIPSGESNGSGGTYENWVTGISGINLESGSTAIRFLVPVDHDDDGDIIGSSMAIEWGCIRPDAPSTPVPSGVGPGHFIDSEYADSSSSSSEDFYTTIAFVAAIPGKAFYELERGIDLNGDGDTADSFQIGHIERQYPAGTCSTSGSIYSGMFMGAFSETIVGDVVVYGDCDGDGSSPDPIFTLNGSSLSITIYTMNYDDERPVLVKTTSAVELGNQ